MRARNIGLSAVAGLALAAGLAVGGEADGGGAAAPAAATATGAVRAEPARAALRVDGRVLHGLTDRQIRRGAAERDSAHMALLKSRATPATIRMASTLPSVDGRLPWAVRTFDRPRLTGGPAGTTKIDPTRPGIRCAQLGRPLGRRFGWVLAPDTFRPLAAETDLQATCATDAGRSGIASSSTLVADRDPYDPAARLRRGVVWGLAPDRVTRVRITWNGWSTTVPVRGGAFLAVGPVPAGPFVDRDARVVDARRPVTPPAPPARRRTPRVWSLVTAEDARIAARLVDPSTGRPSAVVVGTAGGRPCDGGASPIVAGVVGGADPVLQTVYGSGRGCQVIPTLRRGSPPMVTGYGGGIGNQADGADLVDDERLVPGGFGLTVLTPPDVVRVELRSAGDVRTVRPVAPGIVHALYDGSANVGGDVIGPNVDVVGIRADGSTVRATGMGVPEGVKLGSAELGAP